MFSMCSEKYYFAWIFRLMFKNPGIKGNFFAQKSFRKVCRVLLTNFHHPVEAKVLWETNVTGQKLSGRVERKLGQGGFSKVPQPKAHYILQVDMILHPMSYEDMEQSHI